MNRAVGITVFLFLLIFHLPLNINAFATTLYVDPPATKTSVNDTFSLNVTVSGVNDLAGWEIKLYYSSSCLNGTDVVGGPFLQQGGPTYFANINFTDDYNATHGIIWATCALMGAGPGVTGDGILMMATFRAKSLGTSNVTLADTLLSDSQPDPQPILHETQDGTVYVLPHDLAITSLVFPKTVVGQGFCAEIELNVFNKSNFTETFNATAYANATTIATLTGITITSLNYTTVIFMWNTTGFDRGDYTISAVLDPVPSETNITDNSLDDGVVSVGVPCDITGPTQGVPDDTCNMRDIGYICSKFATTPSSPNWDSNADITGPTPRLPDNKVNMRDIGEACSNFGATAQ